MEAQGPNPLLRDGGLPLVAKIQRLAQCDGALRPILMHLFLIFCAQADWGPSVIKRGGYVPPSTACHVSGGTRGLGGEKHQPGGSTSENQ